VSSIVDGLPEINDKWPKKACFCDFNLVIRPVDSARMEVEIYPSEPRKPRLSLEL
jgi:hypothetical protein